MIFQGIGEPIPRSLRNKILADSSVLCCYLKSNLQIFQMYCTEHPEQM